MKKTKLNLFALVSVSILSALASVLMFFSISIPLVPSFLKLDLSELPALIAAFTISPLAGVLVCLVKNMVNVFFTTTGGIGELINFILGSAFVLPAGIIYHRFKSRPGALLGGIVGAFCMSLVSLPLNYYIIYPVYSKIFAPLDVILSLYQKIRPSTGSLLEALVVFNMPFTFVKALISVIISFAVYKPLSPIINGCFVINRKGVHIDRECPTGTKNKYS
ncbi:MAG TPA: ECF transporter S component [Candidatus Avimonas sp.]|nr:ECF transporter S component [Clostridiales bacterium]HPU59133.1 ECF transporter S component [Candidatus Avimonas sp.]